MHIDRQIAIWAGWIAGPAFGVVMMAAPEYFHLSPITAALCFWGGIGVFGMTIIVLGVISFHDLERQKKMIGPILTMALGSIIFMIGAAWYYWPDGQTAPVSAASQDSLQPLLSATTPQRGVTNAKGLFIECHIGSAPSAMPPSGRIFSVEILNSGNIVTSDRFVYKGRDPADVLSIFNPLNTAQCVVTNYSDDVLLSIDLNPLVDFMVTIKLPDGHMEGRGIDHSIISHVSIPKVDTGAERPFVIYFLNQAPSFVNINIPATALAQRLGAQEKSNVPVAANTTSINLPPPFTEMSTH